MRFFIPLLLALAVAFGAQAQQPGRILIVSPHVGEVIDAQEKATYGLFPYYSANDFQQARFEQAPDSAITLYAQLRDGRTVLRPFTRAQFEQTSQAIEQRVQELKQAGVAVNQPATPAAADSIGHRYRVDLRTGTAFVGELVALRPAQLEFRTSDLGIVQVERANIKRLEDLTPGAIRPLAEDWFDIGNGNRLFFQPTARNLRKGEGSLQSINLLLLGANYGVTDNFSIGILTSVVPFVPLNDQLLAFTPKLSAKVSETTHVGGGILYIRVAGESAGIFYGNATFGSADNNFTAGLGYAFASGEVARTPVVQLGGQRRISRRVSLLTENYLITDSEAGIAGLYGIKLNWRRTSLGLAGGYVLSYSDGLSSTYAVPIFYDFTFRFGKPGK
ncbi:hypothetical protein FY528_03435 [Hymenobacter lutimineralis]|uniref:Uncharacterized protein n=1 Tax=Hymenobacter lutimineralis TaxID=2606448 RepID=A0A5D6VC26_9BACT|nr:hypothetical protein [Hymenobacter lutimineralis]TYZ13473.1 hypothetical protein FY528_03435 [Hymenobacter lutimineralis]